MDEEMSNNNTPPWKKKKIEDHFSRRPNYCIHKFLVTK